MNRSVERSRLPATGVKPGEIVFAKGFAHPCRGWIRCPAAKLLAASLRKTDHPARRSEVHKGSDAMLFATTWISEDGLATGFGAAARTADTVAMNLAEQVVVSWSKVLRTRRLLVATTAAESVSPTAEDIALRRTHEYVDRGDTVALIARPGAANGHPSGSTVVLCAPRDVALLTGVDPHRLSFVVVPGIPMEEAATIIAALRTQFPALRGQHPDEFCYEASDRRETLRSVAAASDVLWLCRADPEQIAWAAPFPAHELDCVEQIRPNWLVSAATVGLVVGSSAPRSLTDEVINVLRGLGPLSVVRRQVSTEVDFANTSSQLVGHGNRAAPEQALPVPVQRANPAATTSRETRACRARR